MGAINWNLSTIVFATLVAMPFLGLILGESRLRRTTMAIYIGIVLAQSTSLFVTQKVEHVSKIANYVNYIPLAIFGITVLLMNAGHVPHHETSKKLSARIMIMAVLLSVLLFSSVLNFLPSHMREQVTSGSLILSTLYSTRLIWLVASVLWLIILNMWPQHDDKKKK